MLPHVRDAVITLDASHRITGCNLAAEQLYEFALADVRNHSFGEVTKCHWPPANGHDVAAGTVEGWWGHVRQFTKNGREMLVDVSIIPPHDSAKVDRYITVAREWSPSRRELTGALKDHELFDSLLSDLSTQFSTLPEEHVDGAIESALQALVGFLGASRSSLSQVTPAGAIFVSHTYAVAGVQPAPKGIADDRLPWLVAEMKAGRSVILSAVRDLPPEAQDVRAMMTRSGMKAGLAIPLHVGNALVCVLTFGDFRRERDWPHELTARLRVAGEIFANAIARRQAKEQLQAKQQDLAHLGRVVALSELASVIAHELDQPLTAIITNAQASRTLLEQGPAGVAESKAALADIIADAMRASEIVHRERKLLRKATSNVEPLDVNEVVREIELFIRADARQHGSALKAELSGNLPKVMADRVQLQQVVLNLTRNGIQAMTTEPRDRRVLCISATATATEVVISVRDAGPAVDDERLTRMFEPFFTTKADGLGMGLSISRSIVQAHNGRMWASRNREGSGLTVHIAIPLDLGGAA